MYVYLCICVCVCLWSIRHRIFIFHLKYIHRWKCERWPPLFHAPHPFQSEKSECGSASIVRFTFFLCHFAHSHPLPHTHSHTWRAVGWLDERSKRDKEREKRKAHTLPTVSNSLIQNSVHIYLNFCAASDKSVCVCVSAHTKHVWNVLFTRCCSILFRLLFVYVYVYGMVWYAALWCSMAIGILLNSMAMAMAAVTAMLYHIYKVCRMNSKNISIRVCVACVRLCIK